ncbi:WYL domain-containing protein [bacterium]|nr:WYL domain-containing protein [bacterium]
MNLEETLAVTLALHQAGPSELGELARRGWDKLHYAVINGRERRSKADLPILLSSQSAARMPLPIISTLTTGLLDSRRIRLLYLGLSDRSARWRLVEPWQLFFQDQWYLSAWDPAAMSSKTFRADRICECELTHEVFQREQQVQDPHFHRWDIAGREAVEVHCQVDESIARWLVENPVHPSQKLDGIDLKVKVRDTNAFLRWVCSLSTCRVLGPAKVREAYRQRLEAMLRAQTEEPPGYPGGLSCELEHVSIHSQTRPGET